MSILARAEEQLRQSGNLFGALLEAAPDAMLVIDPTGIIVVANSRVERMFGYFSSELLNKSEEILIPVRFHQSHHDYLVGHLQAPRSQQADKRMELLGLHKDGTEFSIEVSFSPFPTMEGPLVLSAIRDTSVHKRAENLLHISEIRYRRLFETAHDGVLLLDPETRQITDANPYMTTLLGYSHEELVGKELYEIGLLQDEAASQEMVQTLKQTHLVRYEDLPLKNQAGQQQEVEVVANLYDENGHAVIQCNIRDITERKAAQALIENLNLRLQIAVAESHHRIKNNLQVLSALVDLRIPIESQTVSVVEMKRIGQHIRTLASLHDLLTLDSKTRMDLDRISLKAALEKLIPMLQATSGERNISLRADEMTIALKHAGSFSLLVNELVSNGLKHGKGEVQVVLTLLPGPTARLEVCDDGPGFPADFNPEIAANTGLELIDSIGRWDLRGTIVYENREGGGAQIVVTFPLPEQKLPAIV